MPSNHNRWTLPREELEAVAAKHHAGETLADLAQRYNISRHTLGLALRRAGLSGYHRVCNLLSCRKRFFTKLVQQRYCCPAHADEAERRRLNKRQVLGPRVSKRGSTRPRLCMRCGKTITAHLDKYGRCLEHFCARCDERRRVEMTYVEAWG